MYKVIYLNKEGLHKDNACLNTMLRSHMDKTNDFIVKTDISLASNIVLGTSSAPFDMQWSWLGICGIGVGPDTGYGLASMAKQLNSESVEK